MKISVIITVVLSMISSSCRNDASLPEKNNNDEGDERASVTVWEYHSGIYQERVVSSRRKNERRDEEEKGKGKAVSLGKAEGVSNCLSEKRLSE